MIICNFDLQGYRVQNPQYCHSMANIKIYKSCSVHFFALALTVSNKLTFQIVDLEKVGQGHVVQLLKWCHFMADIEIFISRAKHLCASI